MISFENPGNGKEDPVDINVPVQTKSDDRSLEQLPLFEPVPVDRYLPQEFITFGSHAAILEMAKAWVASDELALVINGAPGGWKNASFPCSGGPSGGAARPQNLLEAAPDGSW